MYSKNTVEFSLALLGHMKLSFFLCTFGGVCCCCVAVACCFYVCFSVLEVVVPAGSLIGRAGIIGGEIVELGSVRRPGNIWLDWRFH